MVGRNCEVLEIGCGEGFFSEGLIQMRTGSSASMRCPKPPRKRNGTVLRSESQLASNRFGGPVNHRFSDQVLLLDVLEHLVYRGACSPKPDPRLKKDGFV